MQGFQLVKAPLYAVLKSVLLRSLVVIDCVLLILLNYNAVRRELNLSFMKTERTHTTLKDVVDLIRNIHLVTARLYGFDKDLLDRYLSKGEEFVAQHYNSVKLIEK